MATKINTKIVNDSSTHIVYQRPLETREDYDHMIKQIRIIGQQAQNDTNIKNSLLHGTGMYTVDGQPKKGYFD